MRSIPASASSSVVTIPPSMLGMFYRTKGNDPASPGSRLFVAIGCIRRGSLQYKRVCGIRHLIYRIHITGQSEIVDGQRLYMIPYRFGFFAKRAGSMFPVVGSTSMKSGLAPVSSTPCAVATWVMAGTATRSPGPISWAKRVRCNPAVQLETAMACLTRHGLQRPLRNLLLSFHEPTCRF